MIELTHFPCAIDTTSNKNRHKAAFPFFRLAQTGRETLHKNPMKRSVNGVVPQSRNGRAWDQLRLPTAHGRPLARPALSPCPRSDILAPMADRPSVEAIMGY